MSNALLGGKIEFIQFHRPALISGDYQIGVEPRIHRSWFYAIARAWATVIQLDLQVAQPVSRVIRQHSWNTVRLCWSTSVR